MINVGDKYIIELETVYGGHASVKGTDIKSVPDPLWRVKGFRSLVFDAEGLKKLVPLDQAQNKAEQEAYKKGLDEAWELARKIVAFPNDGGLRTDDLVKIFGLGTSRQVIRKCTASEALAKLRDYEARKKAEDEAVKVGDEVITDGGTRFAVTFVYGDGNGKRCAGYDSDGKHCGIETAYCHKTGRNFPEIAAVLDQMKGE